MAQTILSFIINKKKNRWLRKKISSVPTTGLVSMTYIPLIENFNPSGGGLEWVQIDTERLNSLLGFWTQNTKKTFSTNLDYSI